MPFVGGKNARTKERKENYMTGIAFTVMGRLCVALPVNSVGFGKLCGCTFHRMAIFGTAVFFVMDPNTRFGDRWDSFL